MPNEHCQSTKSECINRHHCLNCRLEDQLLTEQQLMLQASLLQYPHFGVFPGAAAAAAAAAASSGLYPGLAASAAAGVHFPPADYYAAQSLPPGLLMSMKMPNASAANWLGLDRFDVFALCVEITLLHFYTKTFLLAAP